MNACWDGLIDFNKHMMDHPTFQLTDITINMPFYRNTRMHVKIPVSQLPQAEIRVFTLTYADRRMDKRNDKASLRIASPQLKPGKNDFPFLEIKRFGIW